MCGDTWTLWFQIQKTEQDLKKRTELEKQLQHIRSWITDQNQWIDSAQRSSSRTEVEQNITTCKVWGNTYTPMFLVRIDSVWLLWMWWKVFFFFFFLCSPVCQALEEKIRMKTSVLQELREKGSDFTALADKSLEACVALTSQVGKTKTFISWYSSVVSSSWSLSDPWSLTEQLTAAEAAPLSAAVGLCGEQPESHDTQNSQNITDSGCSQWPTAPPTGPQGATPTTTGMTAAAALTPEKIQEVRWI